MAKGRTTAESEKHSCKYCDKQSQQNKLVVMSTKSIEIKTTKKASKSVVQIDYWISTEMVVSKLPNGYFANTQNTLNF